MALLHEYFRVVKASGKKKEKKASSGKREATKSDLETVREQLENQSRAIRKILTELNVQHPNIHTKNQHHENNHS